MHAKIGGSIFAKGPGSHFEEFTINRLAFALQICLFAVASSLLPATGAFAQSLTLAWDPPTDTKTVGYILRYGEGSGQHNKSLNVGYAFRARVPNLAGDTFYCFVVQAYDAAGAVSPYSSEICATTPSSTTPPPTDPPPPDPVPTDPVEPSDPPDSEEPRDPPPAGSDDPVSDPRELVLYASKGTPRGHWGVAGSSGAADGKSMRSTDTGWAAANAPLANPTHYFDVPFDAVAGTPYRIWLRMRAANDSKWNDAVWVQFSGALVAGRVGYQIGSTSALLVNLERCSDCGVRGWGWFNSAYWLRQETLVTFAQSGPQTIRIQTREDGVEIDQVVLSAVNYVTNPPGLPTLDNTILAESPASAPVPPPAPEPTPEPEPTPAPAPTPPPPASTTGTPYSGMPVLIPGVIEASLFDNGASGVAYFDSTSGNSGSVFRSTDVDLEPSTQGFYNIGWTAAGEWVTYTVNVSQSRSYTASFVVASSSGGTLEISAGAPSNTAKTVTVASTGGWQRWTTVNVPITLVAGKQVVKVRWTAGAVNLHRIEIR